MEADAARNRHEAALEGCSEPSAGGVLEEVLTFMESDAVKPPSSTVSDSNQPESETFRGALGAVK